jgi:hypothetical protein
MKVMIEAIEELTQIIRALSKEEGEPDHGKKPSCDSHDGFYLGNFYLTPLPPSPHVNSRSSGLAPMACKRLWGRGRRGGGKCGESDEIARNLFCGLVTYVIFPQNWEENLFFSIEVKNGPNLMRK